MIAAHRQYEPEIVVIRQYEAAENSYETNPEEPIKLLEVNPNTGIEGILPILFFAGIANGTVRVDMIVVEVSPDEYGKIEDCQLPLPEGWNRVRQEIPRQNNGG